MVNEAFKCDGRTDSVYYRVKTIQNHLKLKKSNIFENIQSRKDQIRNLIITKDLKKIRTGFTKKYFRFVLKNFKFCTSLVYMIHCVGGVFTKTEMSEVLTEVVKMDPTFTQERFIQDCKLIYIPNILEVSTVYI
jgi:hypothetical protein